MFRLWLLCNLILNLLILVDINCAYFDSSFCATNLLISNVLTAQPNQVTASEAASPPYTLAAEKAEGRNGQVNGERKNVVEWDLAENLYKYLYKYIVNGERNIVKSEI